MRLSLVAIETDEGVSREPHEHTEKDSKVLYMTNTLHDTLKH